MKSLIFLLPIIFLFSCSNEKLLQERAKHQAGTSSRINDAKQNTDSLFNDL